MSSIWPDGFERIPTGDWASKPVEQLALGYDTVEHHGWYQNLEPTIQHLQRNLSEGDILLDYSGGTGILAERLFKRLPDLRFGFLILDSSPKFLRLALEKLRHEDRAAFRLVRFLRPSKRLQFIDEVLDRSFLDRGLDGLVSTNAIHLYYDLPDTLKSWAKILKPEGLVHVQSGNIRNPDAGPEEWIIDETVEVIHRAAMDIVRREERFRRYRDILNDPNRLARYDALRRKYFLPVRRLDHYVRILEQAGFTGISVSRTTMEPLVSEWLEFLGVYHEGVLGWLGGVEKIEGKPALAGAIEDRLEVIAQAIDTVFEGRKTFKACWTYINCRSGPAGASCFS